MHSRLGVKKKKQRHSVASPAKAVVDRRGVGIRAIFQMLVLNTNQPILAIEGSEAMDKPQRPDRIVVTSISVNSSTDDPCCRVAINVDIGGEKKVLMFESHEKDVGPVSGICGAFREIVPDFNWADFQVKALAPGEGADASAIVTIRNNGYTFSGRGVHNNTLQASAMAVADGLYNLQWHEFTAPMRRYDIAAATTGG
jgi:hypothetical protein